MILERRVKIDLNSNIEYYRDLGYAIPEPQKGTRRAIWVNIEDVPLNSNVKVTKICDDCGVHVKNQDYQSVTQAKSRLFGKDLCLKCALKYGRKTKEENMLEKNRISLIDPSFAKLFWFEKDAENHTCQSEKRADFKCPQCGSQIRDKIIGNVFRSGLSCSFCEDGISYPEKFFRSILNQLDVGYVTEKSFYGWFDDTSRKYDFYIEGEECIVEVHGIHHYEDSFQGFHSRSLDEVQRVDRLKKDAAIANGILEERYIEIDARISDMHHIKNSILKSELVHILDLSSLDWQKCHNDGQGSLVVAACDLWRSKKYKISDIGKMLNLNVITVRKYLSKGTEIGICDYVPKKTSIPVVQLSLEGEFVEYFDSALNAGKSLGRRPNAITEVCKGVKRKTAYGYRWMYASVYYAE